MTLSDMFGWVYLAGIVVSVVPVVKWLSTHMITDGDDGDDVIIPRVFCVFIGMFVALLWFLLVPGVIIYERAFPKRPKT